MNPGTLQSKLQRAEARIAVLEKMIEDKTRDLFLANEELHSAVDNLNGLHDVMPSAVVVVDDCGRIIRTNRASQDLLGCTAACLVGKPIGHIRPNVALPEYETLLDPGAPPQHPSVVRQEEVWLDTERREVPVLVSASQHDPGGISAPSTVLVAVDLRERKQLEVELRHAQKLESIGSLAAGIAHEINTPMQFIGDNLHFLRETFEGMLALIERYEMLEKEPSDAGLLRTVAETKEAIDLEYLKGRAPRAFERTLGGVDRVAGIVSAMKAFSHPEDKSAPTDLNKSVATALTVARAEYKYVADVETDFHEIPMVPCHAGDINQVLLNLVVNASHAIAEKYAGDNGRGLIQVTTQLQSDAVVIAVSDNGGGIPTELQHRVFDPFFTTKAVGKGTGQGLSLARAIVVDKHGGTLEFDSTPGEGTVFRVLLPVIAPTQKVAS